MNSDEDTDHTINNPRHAAKSSASSSSHSGAAGASLRLLGAARARGCSQVLQRAADAAFSVVHAAHAQVVELLVDRRVVQAAHAAALLSFTSVQDEHVQDCAGPAGPGSAAAGG